MRRHYAVTIEGIPLAIHESGFPVSELSGWPSLLPTLHEISEGETTIDLGARRQIGSGFNFSARDLNAALLSLVTPRQDPVAWLVEDMPENIVSISLLTVSAPDAVPDIFYIGQETCSKNGETATEVANVSRALYDGTAQLFWGSTDDGAAPGIFAAPPRWAGRQVTLWASTADASGAMGNKEAVLSARMDDAPSYVGEDKWSFAASSLAQFYNSKPVFQGFQTAYPSEDNSFADVVTMPSEELKKLWGGDCGPTEFVAFTLDDGGFFISRIEAINATSSTVVFGVSPPVGLGSSPEDERRWVSARPILYWPGDPVDVVLSILMSRVGNAALGSYDILQGRNASSFGGAQFYAGASIDASLIDVDSFELFRGQGPGWTVALDEETTAGFFLQEFCQAVGAFWFVTSSGKIAVKHLSERQPPSASSLEITDAIWAVSAGDVVTGNESTVHHTVEFSANWNQLSKEHEATVTVVDAPTKALSPFDENVLKLSSKLVGINVGEWGVDVDEERISHVNPLSRDALEVQLRRIQRYSMRPSAEVTTTIPLQAAQDVSVADIVDVTNQRIPDLRGGRLDAHLALVIGKQVSDYEKGLVSLRVRLLDSGFIFAPSARISSAFLAFGSTYSVVVGLTEYGDSPDDSFIEGWTVESGTRGSANYWSGELLGNIASGSALIAMSTGVPLAGDVFSVVYETGKNPSALGFTPDDFAYMTNDVGDSSRKTRWS